MTENSSEQINDLFVQIRLRLGRVKQNDPETADDIKALVVQLEDLVESLVIDSLKLKSLEHNPKRAPKLENRQLKRPGKE